MKTGRLTGFEYFLSRLSPITHVLQDIFERGNVHFVPVQAVHAVRDCNVSDVVTWEENFDVTARLDIVPAQAGEVLRDNTVDLSGFNIGNHTLKIGAVKVSACVAVVHVKRVAVHAVFLGVVLQHSLLVADAHTLVFAAIFH